MGEARHFQNKCCLKLDLIKKGLRPSAAAAVFALFGSSLKLDLIKKGLRPVRDGRVQTCQCRLKLDLIKKGLRRINAIWLTNIC